MRFGNWMLDRCQKSTIVVRRVLYNRMRRASIQS